MFMMWLPYGVISYNNSHPQFQNVTTAVERNALQCWAVPPIMRHGKYREKIPRYSVVPWRYFRY